MKVNLIVQQEHSKEGYANIPLNQEGVAGIPDSACKELIIDSVLEFVPENMATMILKKIRKGGVLEIRSPDAEEIMRQLQIGSINFEEASALLTGGRARMSTLSQTRSFLELNGLHVEFAGMSGPYYRITAKRE
jgi:hypothetical protein